MTAKRDHDFVVMSADFLVHEFGEGFATAEAGGALGHRGAGTVEAAEREDVDFAEQVSHGTRGKLLLQLVVGNFGCVAGASA